MTILFDLMIRVARAIDEDIYESIATGGGATTLVDSTQPEAADFWNGGTLFFKTGNRANTSAVITDFAAGGTFTFATGAACAATNQYLALTPAWSRARLVQAINTAIQKQNIVSEDETLAAASGTTEFDLPSGVSNIQQVWSGSDADGWQQSHTWHEETGHLRFYAKEPSSGSILLRYLAKPSYVNADADAIDAQVIPDLVVADALTEAWQGRAIRNDENPRAQTKSQMHMAEAERIRRRTMRPNIATRFSGL